MFKRSHVASALLVASSALSAQHELIEVRFFSINDVHATCHVDGDDKMFQQAKKQDGGGYARLVQEFERRREAWDNDRIPYFWVDAGDIFDYHGKTKMNEELTENEHDKANEKIADAYIAVSERIGDKMIVVPGDHDVERTESSANEFMELKALAEGITGNGGSVLACNLLAQKPGGGQFYDPFDGDDYPLDDLVEPFTVRDITYRGEQLRIGFVGVTEPERSAGRLKTPDKEDSLELLKEATSRLLNNKDVHIVVLVGHMGVGPQTDQDDDDADKPHKIRIGDVMEKSVAKRFDLCFDGNSHHGWGGNVLTLLNTHNGLKGCDATVPNHEPLYGSCEGDFDVDVVYDSTHFHDVMTTPAESLWNAYYVQQYKYGSHYSVTRITATNDMTAKQLYSSGGIDTSIPAKASNIVWMEGELTSVKGWTEFGGTAGTDAEILAICECEEE